MAHASAEQLPTEDSDATQLTPIPTQPQTETHRNAATVAATPAPEPARAASDSPSLGTRPQSEPAIQPDPAPERDRVREHFLNWQVMETGAQNAQRPEAKSSARAGQSDPVDTTIEGEAVVLSMSAANAARAMAGAADADSDDTEADIVDSILIAGLPERTVIVKPGSASQLVVSLLNNGSQAVTFDVHVEGWVRDGWLPEGTHHVPMQPGERNALRITFAPPHDPTALAGDFPFVIVVRSTQHLRRVTRLHAKLVIRPFTDFSLGKLEDRQLRRTSRAQSVFTLPVTNHSNHPIAVQLQTQTVGLPTESAWLDPKAFLDGKASLGALGNTNGAKRHAGQQDKRLGDGWQPNPTVISLKTGETREIALRILPRRAPLFGGRPIDASVRVTASVVGEVRMPRSATAELEYTPPIKPWHLALASAASLLLLVLTGITALGATLFLGGNRLASGSQAPIVIVLNQNAPVSAVQAVAQGVAPTPERTSAAVQDEGAPNSAPIVTADQITNPGQAAAAEAQTGTQASSGTQAQPSQLPIAEAPAGTAPVITSGDITAPPQGGVQRPQAPVAQSQARAPAAAAAGSTSAPTYGQMFQEIALQYDLDWRLLAAQAYVETGLDALALGNDGDMGLMQILPGTWKEWAPTVGAVDPFDAYSNTLVASTYLDYVRGELGKRGYPQAQWMLVAYNWGPDRLIDFLDAGGTFETLPAVRAQYATDIIKIARTIP